MLLTSFLTSSTFSPCLLKMCLRTKSGPLNFLPLSGHSHLSLANSCVLALMNFSTSVHMVKENGVTSTHTVYIPPKLLHDRDIALVHFNHFHCRDLRQTKQGPIYVNLHIPLRR